MSPNGSAPPRADGFADATPVEPQTSCVLKRPPPLAFCRPCCGSAVAAHGFAAALLEAVLDVPRLSPSKLALSPPMPAAGRADERGDVALDGTAAELEKRDIISFLPLREAVPPDGLVGETAAGAGSCQSRSNKPPPPPFVTGCVDTAAVGAPAAAACVEAELLTERPDRSPSPESLTRVAFTEVTEAVRRAEESSEEVSERRSIGADAATAGAPNREGRELVGETAVGAGAAFDTDQVAQST